MEREEAYKIAQNSSKLLKERFNVDNVYIFGSVAGDGVWHSRSDIDIAVEGLPSDKYMRALNALYEILPPGIDLDLITLEDAPTKLRECIKTNHNEEYEKLADKIDRLKCQIEAELESLGQLADELDKFMKDVSGRQLSVIELGGVGSILQGFYNGIEKIFERIAIVIDEKLPEGDNWHILLLNQMEIEFLERRPAVIDHELASRLSEYLRFRHLFRNIYGHKLQWEKCQPLAENVTNTLKSLREQLNYFLNQL